MGVKLNSLRNSVSVVPRLAGTVINTACDIFDAFTLPGYDFCERMGSRSRDIKEAIYNATNTGPQRQRRIRRPLAKILGVGSYMTGSIRAGLLSSRDTLGGILKTLSNTFNNAGSAVMRMGEPMPPRDFSYAKLQPKICTPMNSVLLRRFPAIAATPTPATVTPTPATATP